MQRSKSTPAFASPAPSSGLAKTASLVDVRARPPHRAHPSPHRTPRVEHGDPFHLGGFFPAPAKSDGDWAWLRSEDEDEEAAAAAHALFVLPEEEGEDDGAAKVSKVIAREDKLGVLALHFGRLLVAQPGAGDAEEHVPSPLDDEGPADDEALFRALCARRLAYTDRPEGKGAAAGAASVLFVPGDDADEPEEGWLAPMRRVIDML